jgi:hypothetical protein
MVVAEPEVDHGDEQERIKQEERVSLCQSSFHVLIKWGAYDAVIGQALVEMLERQHRQVFILRTASIVTCKLMCFCCASPTAWSSGNGRLRSRGRRARRISHGKMPMMTEGVLFISFEEDSRDPHVRPDQVGFSFIA